jgi:hypothetical protein
MKCVDQAMPDEYGHVPVRCQPPSTGTASPTGAPNDAAKKCSLSSAVCASSGYRLASRRVWPLGRHSDQPVDGQPRATSIITLR